MVRALSRVRLANDSPFTARILSPFCKRPSWGREERGGEGRDRRRNVSRLFVNLSCRVRGEEACGITSLRGFGVAYWLSW